VLAAAALLGAAAILVLRDHLLGQPPGGAAAQPGPGDVLPPAPPAPTPSASASAAPSAEVSHIRVRITATPPGARIVIDDTAADTNPFEGIFVKDVTMHRILVDAYGFAPYRRMIAFDKDVEMTVTLQPKAAGRPGAGAAKTATGLPVNTALPPLKPR
jgi:hypothetical protein